MGLKRDNSFRRTVLLWVGPPAILFVGLVLLFAAHRFPGFSSWYAAHIFPIFPHTIGRFWSIFPFSGFEVLLAGLITFIVADVLRVAIGYFKTRRRVFVYWYEKSVKTRVMAMALRFLYFLAALFLMFVLTAGINFSRESFAYHVGITVRESTIYELEQLYMLLVERAETLAGEIETDEYGRFLLGRDGIHEYARQSMYELNRLYGGLITYFPRAKPLFFSRVLSHMNIGGFFSPWTIEAIYNSDMPGQSIPFVINHELAHVAGHMREEEANFIAYLASRNSENVDFRYSAVYAAISYVLYDLRRVVSDERYNELFAILPEQLQRDIAAAREYWQGFQGRAAQFSTRVNNAYLRANRQQDGVLSYGRIVELLLAYYRDRGLLENSPLVIYV